MALTKVERHYEVRLGISDGQARQRETVAGAVSPVYILPTGPSTRCVSAGSVIMRLCCGSYWLISFVIEL